MLAKSRQSSSFALAQGRCSFPVETFGGQHPSSCACVGESAHLRDDQRTRRGGSFAGWRSDWSPSSARCLQMAAAPGLAIVREQLVGHALGSEALEETTAPRRARFDKL